jgi:hypothetical protein
MLTERPIQQGFLVMDALEPLIFLAFLNGICGKACLLRVSATYVIQK